MGCEEDTCAWMDAQADGFTADEVVDWELAGLIVRENVIYVEVTVIVLGDYRDDEDMIHSGSSGFVRVQPGAALAAARLDLEPRDLPTFIATDLPAARPAGRVDPGDGRGLPGLRSARTDDADAPGGATD